MKRKQANNDWDYAPFAERMAINTASIASLAVVGVTASLLFTPLIFITASAYSALKVSTLIAARQKKLRDKLKTWDIKKGNRIKLSGEHPFSEIVGDLSRQLKRRKSPEIYMINENALFKIQHLPFKRLFKSAAEKQIKKHFSADIMGDFLTVGNRAVNDNHYTHAELKFIAAHEMAHLKTDKFSLPLLAENLGSFIYGSLIYGTMGACALSMAGLMAMPFAMTGGTAALAIGGLAGARIVTHSLSAYAIRRAEQRADRNALYLTGDLEPALRVIEKVSDKKSSILSTHPACAAREKYLRQSFNMVAEHRQQAQKSVIEASDRPKPKQTPSAYRG